MHISFLMHAVGKHKILVKGLLFPEQSIINYWANYNKYCMYVQKYLSTDFRMLELRSVINWRCVAFIRLVLSWLHFALILIPVQFQGWLIGMWDDLLNAFSLVWYFKNWTIKKIQCSGYMDDQELKDQLNTEETSVEGDNPHLFLS